MRTGSHWPGLATAVRCAARPSPSTTPSSRACASSTCATSAPKHKRHRLWYAVAQVVLAGDVENMTERGIEMVMTTMAYHGVTTEEFNDMVSDDIRRTRDGRRAQQESRDNRMIGATSTVMMNRYTSDPKARVYQAVKALFLISGESPQEIMDHGAEWIGPSGRIEFMTLVDNCPRLAQAWYDACCSALVKDRPFALKWRTDMTVSAPRRRGREPGLTLQGGGRRRGREGPSSRSPRPCSTCASWRHTLRHDPGHPRGPGPRGPLPGTQAPPDPYGQSASTSPSALPWPGLVPWSGS